MPGICGGDKEKVSKGWWIFLYSWAILMTLIIETAAIQELLSR